MPDPKPGAISEVAKCLRELRRTRAELTKACENLEEAKERLLDAERRVYEAQSQSPQRVLPIEISQKEREVLERLKQVRDQIDDLLSRHKEEVGP